MKKNSYCFLLMIFSIFFVNSCSDDSDETIVEDYKSDAKEITSFVFLLGGEESVFVDVNGETNLSAVLPALTDVTNLAPEIIISEKATISPKSGVAQDFTSPVRYTVTAEDGSIKSFLVSVSLLDPSSDNEIKSFFFKNLAEGQASYNVYDHVSTDVDSLVYYVPYLSPIKELKSEIFIGENATIAPESGEILDYSQPVKYLVTAQNGEQREYLVFVENNLEDLKIEGFAGDIFKDKKPGDLISFNVNEVNPIQDSIKVNLFDRISDSKVALKVEKVEEIDSWTKTITAKLPDSYVNSIYGLEVTIEHDNMDTSDGFILYKGIPNFVNVDPDFKDGEYVTVTGLLSPESYFDAKMYVDKFRFDDYKFYLKQNGLEYELQTRGHDVNFSEVHFKMMDNLAELGGTTGTDYEIVIAVDGTKYNFPLINDKNELINVIATDKPVISGIDKSTVVKGKTVTLTGEHLFYDTTLIGHQTLAVSQLLLNHPTNFNLRFSIGAISNTSDSITFEIPDDIQSGTYEVSIWNSLGEYEEEGTQPLLLTVELPESEHPSIRVTEAVIYFNQEKPFHRQVRVSFNENIENAELEDFLLGANTIEVGNYLINPTSILTSQWSDENANKISNFSDGSIIIDGYKLYFTVEDSY